MKSLLLISVLLPYTLSAQSGSGKATSKALNNRFTITYQNATASWKVGSTRITSTELAQAVTDNLAKRLSQKGFVRTTPLDVRCCNLQVQIANATLHQVSSGDSRLALAIRITVLDVDGQFVYTREYRAEAPVGSGPAGGAAEIGKAAMEDKELLTFLAGS